MRTGLIAAVLCAAVAGAAAPARAWTEAQVESLRANVEIGPDGHAQIAMQLRVRVHAGWLDALEVAGLDPGFELDAEKPPYFVSEDGGTKYDPAVRLYERQGRIAFSFRRRTSPRRGGYVVGLVYRADLSGATAPTDEGGVRVRYILPGWRSGLDGVTVSMWLPPGARDASVALNAVEATELRTRERTVLTWTRAHLPRTVAWVFEAEVPEGAMAPELRRARPVDRRPPRPDVPLEPARKAPALLAALVALFALLKRGAFAVACRRLRARPRPLVPMPWEPLRAALVLVLASLAGWLWPEEGPIALALLGAVVLLGLERTPVPAPAPRFGVFRPASRADLRAARRAALRAWLGPLAFLDLTSPVGFLLPAAAVVSVLALARVESPADPAAPITLFHGLALLAPLFVTGTRHQLPLAPLGRLHRLCRIARRLRVPLEGPAIALRPMLHAGTDGVLQDARLRVVTDERPEGLVRCDVAIAERRALGGFSPEPVLVVVTRRGTRAEAAVARSLPRLRAEDAPGGRIARIAPAGPAPGRDLVRVVGALRPRTV
jgi:hypothetical protein